MTERYRNHPIVICRSLVVSAILFFIIWFNIITNREEVDLSFQPEMLLLLLIPVLLIIYYTVWWRKTYITLEEDHAVAESWVFYGRTKVIPYGKVASVNEVKGLIGRLIGVTTLQININSAQNAARPEITFTFKDELADYVAKLLKYGADEKPVAETQGSETEAVPESLETEEDCIYRFGMKDAVMFGIFGSNTWSLIITLVFGIYSYVSLFFEATASFISILFMILSGVVPMVRSIVRHGNFRIYRSGSRIRIIHGMAAIYDTTFDVSKVNAITIKRTLFARLLG
ncbi:MAG: hypothetical protein MJZ21_06455, partial [archaeon]|nr:hypothetical protein [archaeon]